MYPDKREYFKKIYEENYKDFTGHVSLSCEVSNPVVNVRRSLEFDWRPYRFEDDDYPDSDTSSEEIRDEESKLPEWYKRLVRSEVSLPISHYQIRLTPIEPSNPFLIFRVSFPIISPAPIYFQGPVRLLEWQVQQAYVRDDFWSLHPGATPPELK